MNNSYSQVEVFNLGTASYPETWQKMREFTLNRNPDTKDQFWQVEHPPVFTMGLAGLDEHLLIKDSGIPVIKTDRGGQITYHGPGQVVIYTLIDIKRLGISIRKLVTSIEDAIINYLQDLGIKATGNRDAPGVYVNHKKIASLGLKVSRGCTYHGMSFNIDMDITPFKHINVCGYKDLAVTQLKDELINSNLRYNLSIDTVVNDIIAHLVKTLYTHLM